MTVGPRLPAHAASTIHQFLRSHVRSAGARGVAVGLSGGIDSALVARLARDALGAERVVGVLLPDGGPSLELVRETEAYAAELGIAHRTVPITSVAEAALRTLPEVVDPVAQGNLRARIRMALLYAVARERGALVAGTGNKSELLLGYYTKYGDGGVDLLPIGDLYKTEVRQLAEELGLPEAIRRRAPSAGFWEGQTDEGELGAPYATLDPILLGIEELRPVEEIAERVGVDRALVERTAARVLAGRHKRVPVPVPKLRLRTVGLDWRD